MSRANQSREDIHSLSSRFLDIGTRLRGIVSSMESHEMEQLSGHFNSVETALRKAEKYIHNYDYELAKAVTAKKQAE